MQKKILKEIGLRVGTSPADKPATKNLNFNSLGGFYKNADDVINQRISLVNEKDDDEEDQEVNNEDILELRKKINGKYALLETLDNVEKELMNEFVGDFIGDVYGAAKSAVGHGAKVAANVAKSGLGAIPVLDAVIGSYRIANLASSINDFSDKISEIMRKPKGYFGDALKADSEQQFNRRFLNIINYCLNYSFMISFPLFEEVLEYHIDENNLFSCKETREYLNFDLTQPKIISSDGMNHSVESDDDDVFFLKI